MVLHSNPAGQQKHPHQGLNWRTCRPGVQDGTALRAPPALVMGVKGKQGNGNGAHVVAEGLQLDGGYLAHDQFSLGGSSFG